MQAADLPGLSDQGIEEYGSWLDNATTMVNAAGRSAFLETLWHEALEAVRAALGEAHPQTGTSYNNKAFNLDDQDRYAEAEPLHRKALEIKASGSRGSTPR